MDGKPPLTFRYRMRDQQVSKKGPGTGEGGPPAMAMGTMRKNAPVLSMAMRMAVDL